MSFCPLCNSAKYKPFTKKSYDTPYFIIEGEHCDACGYYKQTDGKEGISVLVICGRCNTEQWIPDFPNAVPVNGDKDTPLITLPMWRCLKCRHSNNALTTIKR